VCRFTPGAKVARKYVAAEFALISN